VLYLHHDQQGSTRLLTGSTGKTEASFTYDAYGNKTGSTGTSTTPLGYDGQYTNSDTGFVYLRARYYDPATAQFSAVDPASEKTQEPYTYALDDPLTIGDPTGLTPWSGKVKQAIAQCLSWKVGPSKNSGKNPFYHNKVFYQACEDLLHLPPEVFGTGQQAESHTGLRVTAGVAGAASVAFGVGTFVACEGVTDAIGTAHCALATLPSVQIGLVALGYAILGH
jgi:RHS repeat-associated protein